MEQTIQNHVNASAKTITVANVETKNKTVSDFWEKAEFSRFAITPMILIIVACVGGIAAAVGIQQSAFKLAVVALTTAGVEACILAVTPMRVIIIGSIISLIVSLLVIII